MKLNIEPSFRISLLAIAAVLASCKTTPPQQQPMSAAQCAVAKRCVAEGQLTMSTDGHAFIGELQLADGSCINVSLPQRESKRLFGKPPTHRLISGAVFPFPFADEEMFSWKVNGRQIGFGSCGAFYVFSE